MESGARSTEGRHIIFYDGVCGLCNRLIRTILNHDKKGLFAFSSLQSAFANETLPAFGKDPKDLDSLFVLVGHGTKDARVLEKGRASLFIWPKLGGLFVLTAIFAVFPTAFLDFCYDLIAKRRYRIFGRYDVCPIPSAEQRERFVDI